MNPIVAVSMTTVLQYAIVMRYVLKSYKLKEKMKTNYYLFSSFLWHI